MPKTDFKDLSFNISNYCISSCKYCSLGNPKFWNLDDEMQLKHVEALLTDPILKNLVTIHLTGGEPFLSPKILAIADLLYEYYTDTPINLPTNALYPNLIYRLMQKIIKKLPQLRLNIGLEGPNKKVHESIRGKGSWQPVWETVKLLKVLGVNLVFNMTLFKENYHFIRETKALADKWDAGFYLNLGRFSRRFGNKKDDFMWYDETEEMIKEIEEAIKDTGWLQERKLNLQKWIIQKAFWRRQKVHFNCLSGIQHIDVFPNGNVYPCLMYREDYRFGNIKEAPATVPLTAIMNTEHSRKLQERIYRGDCSTTCPFTCQLRLQNLTIDGNAVKI